MKNDSPINFFSLTLQIEKGYIIKPGLRLWGDTRRQASVLRIEIPETEK